MHAQSFAAATRPTLPPVSAAAIYSSANWSTTGPNAVSCSSGSDPFDNDSTRNNSRGTIDPYGGVAPWNANFDCTASSASGTVGRLAWNSTTKTLTIAGTVFLDGNFNLSSNNGFRYVGNGTIYVNGVVTSNGIVCGPPPESWTPPKTCGQTWDPNNGELLIVACNATTTSAPVPISFNLGGQAVLEAGAWAIGNGSTANGNGAFTSAGGTTLGGSVLLSNGYADISGGGNIHAFISLPSAAPTNYVYRLDPNGAQNFSG
jgi:hypothetical protein